MDALGRRAVLVPWFSLTVSQLLPGLGRVPIIPPGSSGSHGTARATGALCTHLAPSKISSQRFAPSSEGLGKRLNGLKLPKGKCQAGFVLGKPSTPARLWVSEYLPLTAHSIFSFLLPKSSFAKTLHHRLLLPRVARKKTLSFSF